jgi:hypothetical protein
MLLLFGNIYIGNCFPMYIFPLEDGRRTEIVMLHRRNKYPHHLDLTRNRMQTAKIKISKKLLK